MMYPYATLSDTTEVVHSEIKSDVGLRYIERKRFIMVFIMLLAICLIILGKI